MIERNKTHLAAMIDHTNLKPDAQLSDIKKLCEEAREHQFYSVCVHSNWVNECSRLLAGSGVKISAVCGFPLGANAPEVKAYEAAFSVENGAEEIDMVMSVGMLKSGNEAAVIDDIQRVVRLVQGKAIVKVILETGLLTENEIVRACQLAEKAGARFVKTSTGFGPRGASLEDIVTMKNAISEHVFIKASGGIRSWDDAWKLIEAGAQRIGTSAGPAIMAGQASDQEY